MTSDNTSAAHETVRAAYWLNAENRNDLADAIREACTFTISETLRLHLAAVLTELGVVSARERLWPAASTIVRRTNGWTDDVLPIRMSETEVAAALAIPHLSTTCRAALTGGRTQ